MPVTTTAGEPRPQYIVEMNNRQPFPSSPNAKVPLYAVGNDVDVDRLNFSRVLFLDIDGSWRAINCSWPWTNT
jgi:hypothetical protein